MTASEQIEARYSRRIEAAAIGGLILCPRKLDEVRPWLKQDDFAVAHYGRWYGYICELQDEGQPIDQVTLLTELRRHHDLGHRWPIRLRTSHDHGAGTHPRRADVLRTNGS